MAYWELLAMTEYKNKIIVVGLIQLLLFLPLSGCILSSNQTINTYQTIIVGVHGDIQGFYPQANSFDVDTVGFNFNIYEALVFRQADFTIAPRLAKSWTNPDNLTWRFKLQDNVLFHNNDPLTVEDVKYSLDFIINNNQSMYQELVKPIRNITIIDNKTIEIRTKKPTPLLLSTLVELPIINKDYVEGSDNLWPIGTGPYQLANYTPKTNYTLKRFEQYWGNLPDVQTVVLCIMHNTSDTYSALLSQEIQITTISLKNITEVEKTKGVHTLTITTPSVTYLSFNFAEKSVSNQSRNNPLKYQKVREALTHCINISSFLYNVTNNSLDAANQLVSPHIYGYNPNIKAPEYDVDLAKSLLSEAGYPHGFNLTLDIPEYWNTENMPIGDEIAHQLKSIINVTVNSMPGPDYYSKILQRESDFYLMSWLATTGDAEEVYSYILHSVDDKQGKGSYNLGYYYNPTIDSIADNISYIMNSRRRLETMQSGFEIAMDDVYCIPLYHTKVHYGIVDGLSLEPRPDLSLLFEEIHINYKVAESQTLF